MRRIKTAVLVIEFQIALHKAREQTRETELPVRSVSWHPENLLSLNMRQGPGPRGVRPARHRCAEPIENPTAWQTSPCMGSDLCGGFGDKKNRTGFGPTVRRTHNIETCL
jgi:hypothetical protein